MDEKDIEMTDYISFLDCKAEDLLKVLKKYKDSRVYIGEKQVRNIEITDKNKVKLFP